MPTHHTQTYVCTRVCACVGVPRDLTCPNIWTVWLKLGMEAGLNAILNRLIILCLSVCLFNCLSGCLSFCLPTTDLHVSLSLPISPVSLSLYTTLLRPVTCPVSCPVQYKKLVADCLLPPLHQCICPFGRGCCGSGWEPDEEPTGVRWECFRGLYIRQTQL